MYKNWTSPSLAFRGARMLLAIVNHPVPFFDDSYAVNSENCGPYGDAITYELIPHIEKTYRGIGKGWVKAIHIHIHMQEQENTPHCTCLLSLV